MAAQLGVDGVEEEEELVSFRQAGEIEDILFIYKDLKGEEEVESG